MDPKGQQQKRAVNFWNTSSFPWFLHKFWLKTTDALFVYVSPFETKKAEYEIMVTKIQQEEEERSGFV